ncbi:ABC transporter substrate-binding protein [Actinacidiphila bryophytorum]|uniref:non-specific serine/threonine protein kinase n=1 Tax=Actinacidiphila bryophytorum TaxID=1436133 RepID=A0A9W4E7F4_9ACTN|nr:ABC transporter substrate-binding protein [Actinacidiphila bryophytorum]MBM9436112.1 protein kinase [Actinacidiphila bryophytorum]MBN6543733.1 protein kinase [Actinacidiphila bryophytorum]CAG7634194.1 Peptide/nickel transport system substrate-binding protein [Actinacidiphila bryophytorum]
MTDGLFAGRYQLQELLGAGGMARVHRAQDTRMGRTVAVKTLLPELAGDPDARRRFAREAQAAGALNHPGIVTVHDQDEVRDGDDVVPYLVMEYVRGGTLAQLVRQQVYFAPERAVRITCDILDALAHAHRHGTVHRDVKPANVMVTTEGVVKVADFGIARVLDTDARLTTTGSAIGTPSYMSPEQINGAEVDARSDVYSVGCVLTELLTGRPPFTDGNPINLMYWHVHTPPPAPSARNPRVPAELDALVLTALAKDPADRHFDAAVFRDRLRNWLTVSGHSALLAGPAAPPADDRATRPLGSATGDPRATFGTGAGLPAAPSLQKPPTPAQPSTPPQPVPPQSTPPASTPPPATPPRANPFGAAPESTPPPSAPAEHPAYALRPQVPLPPPYHPGTPPPLNGPSGTGEFDPARRARRRWIAGVSGLAVAAVAATVTFVFVPLGSGKGGDDPTTPPTHPPTVTLAQDAALKMHGGKEGAGYGGGLDGVVKPSSKRGGTLQLAASSTEDGMLDPARTYSQPSWNVQRLYLRKLVDYAPKPGAAGRALMPDLATDTGRVSSDGYTWTFTLKSGVTFQDGTPITSQDIKYGIERTFDRTVFGTGPTYFVDLLDQGQNYPGPYKDTDPDKLGLHSIATPDKKTIVFTLSKPFADFRYVLAMSMAAPVPRDKDTGGGKDFQNKPVSSGPYEVKTFTDGSSLRLVRNSHWDPATDSIHSALPDEIDLRYYSSQEAVEDALLSGSADLDLNGETLSDGAETKLLNDPALKSRSDLVYNGATRYLTLQTGVAPFGNQQCRWAIEYAVDRSQIRAVLGGQYDGGDVATTMLPPVVDGYDPDATPFGYSDGTAYPTQAKQQLAACHKPNGFDVTLAGPSNSPRLEDAMLTIQHSLAAVGIRVKIVQVSTADYYATLTDPGKLKKAGWGMALTVWAADWPTGGGFLRTLVQPGNPNNYAGLNDSNLNGMVEKADTLTDPAAAAAQWKKVDAAVMSDSTMVPLVYARHLVYRGSRLTNAYEQQVLGGIDLTALGVQS